MPKYRVMNRFTGEQYDVDAPYAQVACRILGWMIGDCWIKRMDDPAKVRPIPFTDATANPAPTYTDDDLANAPTGESG